jgi:hypothetical protein
MSSINTLPGSQWSNVTIPASLIEATGDLSGAALSPTLIQYAQTTLTNAQVLALRAAPITCVTAPGAGKVLEFISAVLIFDYTAAYTESTANLAFKYDTGAGVQVSDTIEATGFADATADTLQHARSAGDIIVAASAAVNKPIVLHNLGAGEWGGGNAANAIRVKVAYRSHTTGL